jgi:hypothetical protein
VAAQRGGAAGEHRVHCRLLGGMEGVALAVVVEVSTHDVGHLESRADPGHTLRGRADLLRRRAERRRALHRLRRPLRAEVLGNLSLLRERGLHR